MTCESDDEEWEASKGPRALRGVPPRVEVVMCRVVVVAVFDVEVLVGVRFVFWPGVVIWCGWGHLVV